VVLRGGRGPAEQPEPPGASASPSSPTTRATRSTSSSRRVCAPRASRPEAERYGTSIVVSISMLASLTSASLPNSPLSALKTDEWNQTVDVNIKGVLNGVAAVLPTFVSQKSGHIITTSSVAGLKSYPGGAVYGGTKWFVRDFMEVLRMESAQEGTNIRTATIYPAAINTELLDAITHEGTSEQAKELYDQYGISADRIANVVAFAVDQPDDTNVNEFTVGPTTQPW
jgi:NADP-dependent 3-hydroxy acid dehydrogenase YdfG